MGKIGLQQNPQFFKPARKTSTTDSSREIGDFWFKLFGGLKKGGFEKFGFHLIIIVLALFYPLQNNAVVLLYHLICISDQQPSFQRLPYPHYTIQDKTFLGVRLR